MNAHRVEIRVRYEETDQMGVVYYANYLVWFEIARTEFFRIRGVSYREIEEKDNIYFPVVEAYCRYRMPLKYDDLVTVDVRLEDIGVKRVSFEYEVKKDGKLAATGRTKHAFVDAKGIPIPVPGNIREAIQATM